MNLLLVIDALLRFQSVSKASQHLNMSQSSVSHALKKLRIYFGDELFIRSHDGMAPTPRAVEISEYIFNIMENTKNMLLPKQIFSPMKNTGPLKISLGDVGEMIVLPEIIKKFREQNVEIIIKSVDSSSEESVAMLEDGRIDLYVGIVEKNYSDIYCQKLYEDELVLVSARKIAESGHLTIKDIEGMGFMALQSRTDFKEKNSFSEYFAKIVRPDHVLVETPYISSIPLVLEKNHHLFSIIPKSAAMHYEKRFGIFIYHMDYDCPKISINQYWHKRFNKDPFIMWIRNILFDIFSNYEYTKIV